jgi:sugar lactone lactonase YvrE
MAEYATSVVLGERRFLEGPHWHDGEIWTSDVHRRQVIAVGPSGSSRLLADVDDKVSGLGFLPDGSAIVVSVLKRQVRRLSDLSVYADLSQLMLGGANDMIVDSDGRAYVGSFGYDVFAGDPVEPGNVVLVETDGSARVVAEGIGFPNGMVITDRRTLLVAATYESRILEFDIKDDGSLVNRRVWTDLPGEPDGMTRDREGAVWVAIPQDGVFLRIDHRLEHTDTVRVRPGWRAISCCLGGPDGRDLYATTALYEKPTQAALEVVRVPVPAP